MTKEMAPSETHGDSAILGALQTAIDTIYDSGGGTVALLPGIHASGPLELRSGVNLELAEGAVLTFASEYAWYPPVFSRWEGVDCWCMHPMIRLHQCADVEIRGAGVIDGGGESWWRSYRSLRGDARSPRGSADPDLDLDLLRAEYLDLNRNIPRASGGGGRETGFLRPPLLQISNSRDIVVRGLTLRNSAFWNTHVLYSEDILLDGLKVFNPADSPNTDGINIDSSSRVQVRDCLIDVGDDCLGIKSGSDEDGLRVARPSEDIAIRGCSMNRGHGAVVFGSEVSGGIRNVTVEGCRFSGTDRGIRIKSRPGRGGYVENILVSDIEMDSVAAPITVNLQYRCGLSTDEQARLRTGASAPGDGKLTLISNIRLSSIRAVGARIPAVLLGSPEAPIRGIRIEDYSYQILSSEEAFEAVMTYADETIGGEDIWIRHAENVELIAILRMESDPPVT
jgi:polygalacturonase